jgi:uncharacterized repeat protein (TIGR03803 family)
MRREKGSIAVAIFFTILIANMFAASASAQETVLYSFKANDVDGNTPYSGLVSDAAGNLYGTTFEGGTTEFYGTVFELTPGTSGWTESVLHNFVNGHDGSVPQGGLIMDSSGNLYGTTIQGGGFSCGTVFRLSPAAGGGWTETIPFTFDCSDGLDPAGTLVFDPAGNLYGTAGGGGAHDAGIVFELIPGTGGTWTEAILHAFNSGTNDGNYPTAGLVRDASGNLYGTTFKGGSKGRGMVFELSPTGTGGWRYTALHEFGAGDDGQYPYASLIRDASGNLYGTTAGGGVHGSGTVFEISPRVGGGSTEKVIHSFGQTLNDGVNPLGALVTDSAGNLYGTTEYGGANGNFGTVFELSPTTGGTWIESVLHSFNDNGDGFYPYAALITDGSGNFYGTTTKGGSAGLGTVFKIVP